MKSRDLFIVNFGLRLWLTSQGVTGFWQDLLAKVLAFVLGDLIDRGIFVIDLTIDSIKIALQKKEYREAALKAYAKAKAKVYTDEEKKAIRAEYQAIIRKFVPVGDGVRKR